MPDSRRVVAACDIPEHEAVRLVSAVVGTPMLAVRAGVEMTDDAASTVLELAARRRAGEPLQYLEGTAPFGPIEVVVDRRVLIPRPETELLYEKVLASLRGGETVVDLGTGSGALALALKHEAPDITMIATDLSDEALEVAAANAARLGVVIELRKGSLYEALDPALAGTIDVIVSNPPYVAPDEWEELAEEVRLYEPRRALLAADGGLAVIRSIVARACDWLAPGGRLYVEIGATHEDAVLEMLPRGLVGAVDRDLTGRPRYLVAEYVPDDLNDGIRALRHGEVVGMPTDTVYGLAADATNPGAVRRLYELKGRAPDKAIPVLVASVDQGLRLGEFSDAARAAAQHWPGPLTLVVPMRPGLPPEIGDHRSGTIGLRVPDHPVALRLLAAVGPLAVTSANLSGDEPVLDARSARALFGPAVAVYVAGKSGGGLSSTVLDVSGFQPRVLRRGPIDL